jgi:alginate O-acetyltransferase complex protein AlgI
MLFNSLEFIFCFLPITIFVYSVLRVSNRQLLAKLFMAASSIFFYGWWNVRYVPLVLGSVLANYLISLYFKRSGRSAKFALVFGITFNLSLLIYFKYYNFFMENVAHLLDLKFMFAHIALPLAISFFTFQQIAYLVESYKDRKPADSFLDYSLFVLFFPHLIAGPITNHKEMLPQFKEAGHGVLDPRFVSIGVAVFLMGLAKKVLVADTVSSFADQVFNAADAGHSVSVVAAWIGALAYTFQLYFDFAGYSDMALGLGLLFGIRLPVNFASPYKSTSIIEFWSRWHISLSRFLRNYLYIPLGGNRHGKFRRYLNLFLTMSIGGLWHGAGWNFMCWGALHGVYLMINHAWQHVFGMRRGKMAGLLGWMATFGGVVFAWVLFRATTWSGAHAIIKSMLCFSETNGINAESANVITIPAFMTLAICAGLAFFSPSALEIAGYPDSIPGASIETAPLHPLRKRITGAPVYLGILAAFIIARLPDPGVFLYFNF